MTKYDIATPYTAVFLVLRKDGKIAMVLRRNTDWMNDHWGLVAGKVEKNEPFIAAAIREAKEEAGVTIRPEDLRQVLIAHRYEPDSTWVDVFFETDKWEGQVHNAEPEKATELAWQAPDNLPDNVIPVIHKCIEAIETGKTYLEYGWEA